MTQKRQLGLIHVFSIACAAMISSGIFVLPGMAHAMAGPAVVVSYLLAGILATVGLLSIVELTTAMPMVGGDYFYISRGLGPAAGTLAGLLSWFSLALKSAFALIGLAVLGAEFVPVNWHILAAAACLIAVLVNLYGTREAASLQVVLVAALIGLMLSFVVKGMGHVSVANFTPPAPHGIRPVISTAGFVFVSYGGLIQVASVAGEIKRPGRTIPRGMILAAAVTMVLYALMIIVASGVLGAARLDGSLTPISDAAEAFWGRTGFIIVSIAAALAFITTANAGIMTASRYLLAASSDELLPEPLSRIGSRRQTPYMAILATGVLILGSVFFSLEALVKAASTVFVLGYILASVSVIVLRESGVQNYRPNFRAPLYPWLQVATIVGFAFVLVGMGEGAFVVTGALIAAGFCIYWLYGRRRVEKESALLHLIEKVTARELVTGTLEHELKEIIRERDEIVQDRFDRLVEKAVVLDVAGPMEVEPFFEQIAERMAGELGIEAQPLKEMLIARERAGSTVLSADLAIPHVVIEGHGVFEIAIARCRDGVRFSDKNPHVTTVFVLVGTANLRNVHLRALSAIAQIVQTPGFEDRWMAARNEQALKDLVLLGKRKRLH
ncbi:MAG: amino acid permease [Phycisphaerae bacterium]|nr:amino acid permease [Phycisphaerae bacterium]